jgi:cell division septation protein DedD
VKPAPQAKPAAAGEVFVVQLAALSDPPRPALKGRAVLAGLPAYTDKSGA